MLALAALVVAVPASAQLTPPPQQQGSGQILQDMADAVFQEIEKKAIEDYYDLIPNPPTTKGGTDERNAKQRGKGDNEDARHGEKHGKNHESDDDGDKHRKKDKDGKGRGAGLPPGLAKRDQLPPGLAKRGNRLPAGLAKADLPPDLEERLPPLPDNIERVVVDSDVLLIQKGTNLILDVIEGVIRN